LLVEASPYPRFSEREMDRRRDALLAAMAGNEVEHLVVYGANRSGPAVGWLTRWPVTREALVVVSPGERDLLLVNFYNHVPNAQRIATECTVRWAGNEPMATALEELRRRGASGRGIGVIGALGYRSHSALSDFGARAVSLDAAYKRLRLRKSAEEIEWLRVGAAFTDAAVDALRAQAAVGLDERRLGDIVERAYVGRGGTTHIHYFGVTPMDAPVLSVPAQWPSSRALQRGDALTCEISASFWDYTGQVLRTFAVGGEPTDLYRELHTVADAAFDVLFERLRPGTTAAELVEASRLIEEAGFTIRDDLVHGFVGGYLPPVLGSTSRTLAEVPDFVFEAGMTIVVQPNVVTPDERAGVQTGELVHVTEVGAERLHTSERGLLRISDPGWSPAA
jgi:Xaa-Pro aminopeptidase